MVWFFRLLGFSGIAFGILLLTLSPSETNVSWITSSSPDTLSRILLLPVSKLPKGEFLADTRLGESVSYEILSQEKKADQHSIQLKTNGFHHYEELRESFLLKPERNLTSITVNFYLTPKVGLFQRIYFLFFAEKDIEKMLEERKRSLPALL